MSSSPPKTLSTPPPHLDREDIKRAYNPSGSERAQIRRNQLLPLDWKHLSDGDMWEIASLLWDEPSSDVSELELEAMLAIAAILTTGRNLGRLHDLRVYENMQRLRTDNAREGLVLKRKSPVWCLIAGSPARQKDIKAASKAEAEKVGKKGYLKSKTAQARPTSNDDDREIAIPVAPIVLARLKHCKIKARKDPTRLLNYSVDALIPEIERLLGTRRGPGVAQPRRCSRTLESLTRFLTVEMIHQAGVDIATAARLTDSNHPSSRVVIHYGVYRSRNHGKRILKATGRLDPTGASHAFSSADEQQLGSLLAPTDKQVKALIERLSTDLQSSRTLMEKHRAILTQTVALVSFAVGHRGLESHLPSTAAIDHHTGFCRIHEKDLDDQSKARMVWVAKVARQQIAEYERHLVALELEMPAFDFRPVQDYVSEGKLPIFNLTSESIDYCIISDVWTQLRRRAPQLECTRRNSGRHWLRSNLDGKCSAETLHAMFGHWDIGGEPWSYGSCLDPIVYRADLERTIPNCLTSIGWTSLSSPLVSDRG